MRSRKSKSLSVDKPVAETSKHRISIVPLEEIPIDDPQHEKTIFEKGEFLRKLNSVYTSDSVVASSNDMTDKRIIEVYRRCFIEAKPNAQTKVLTSFSKRIGLDR
jgi:hypothetical protein